MTPVGWKPSDFVEGGAVPVDKNLTWKENRFNVFDYTKKDGTVVASTVALRVTYVDDSGNEFVQQYSAADKERFTPSPDGKTLVAITEGAKLTKSSNFAILVNALINAGFPENRIPESGDVSVLDGLYTYNIGLPEPKRAGLQREEGARERVLSVPSKILRLPGEKKGRAATKTAAKGGDDGVDVTALALKFVADNLGDDGSTTRQKLATAVFRKLAKDPNKDAIAGLIFRPEFQVALLSNGYSVEGETISKGD